MIRSAGTFDVKLVPQAPDDPAMPSNVARMLIDKRFHGSLEGDSRGQMLAVRTDVEGSAGYVAVEQFSGTLDGRSGTFVLQHSGIMSRGEREATITVVPDSGTGQLEGLSGAMRITLENGQHSYEFDYGLPAMG